MNRRQLGTKKTLSIVIALGLSGCGGGSTSTAPAPVVPVTPSATNLTLSGTASRGTAFGAKTIAAKCAAGIGSTTSAADGSYTMTIASGKWPCLARLTDTDGSTLHSVAQGSSTATAATANITPVTQLVVARLAGADPAGYYSAYDSTAATFVTTATVAAAQTAVVATLKSAGIDLTAAGDLITSATVTSAYTSALVKLNDALVAGGTSLADLTTAVVNSAPATAAGLPVITVGLPTLPPDQILQPAASTCAAMRSGKYRVVIPIPGAPLSDQVDSFQINVATGAIVYANGSTQTVAANGTCRFSDRDKSDFVVSPAGVMVGTITDGAKIRTAIVIPEQQHSLADLAGTWNIIGMNPWDGALGFGAVAGTVTVGTEGKILTGSACSHPATWDVVTCGSFTPGTQPLRVNVAGGFDLIGDSGNVAGRSFMYQAGSGDLMYIQVYNEGNFNIWTKQKTNSLPTVGEVKTHWGFAIDEQLLSTGVISADTNTIVSVDAAAGSWVRKQKTVGGTDEHSETFFANNPRIGYNYRAASSTVAADGTTVNLNQSTTLGLRGMGLTAVLNQSKKRFQFSVEQSVK